MTSAFHSYSSDTPRTDEKAWSFRRMTVGSTEAAIEWARELERELQSRGPKTPSINVEGRDFYELCQAYRWAQPDPIPQFEALKEYIKTGKLPWDSYDEEELRHRATGSEQGEKT